MYSEIMNTQDANIMWWLPMLTEGLLDRVCFVTEKVRGRHILILGINEVVDERNPRFAAIDIRFSTH